jgi:hypothetical protein
VIGSLEGGMENYERLRPPATGDLYYEHMGFSMVRTALYRYN